MKKVGKVFVLIGGLYELIFRVILGIIAFFIGAKSVWSPGSKINLFVLSFFLVYLAFSILLFVLSILIYKEKNPSEAKLWTIIIVSVYSSILQIIYVSLPLGSSILLLGTIFLLVNNHNVKHNPTLENRKITHYRKELPENKKYNVLDDKEDIID